MVVSYELDCGLKDVGYPQYKKDVYVTKECNGWKEGEILSYMDAYMDGVSDDCLVSAPRLDEVWKWFWKDKHIYISVLPFGVIQIRDNWGLNRELTYDKDKDVDNCVEDAINYVLYKGILK